jgi:dTDP-4-dehydrorhamnose 3,5-epimerase
MNLLKTNIIGVYIINSPTFIDDRGTFLESYNKETFNTNIAKINFIQDNESKSRKGVLRGLHFQKPPYAQAKLVRCVEGKVLDVAVDIRDGSDTYGEYITVELSAENKKQVFIPRGFAHGFLVLSNSAIVSYKVDNSYEPAYDAGIRWDDPMLNIQWGVNESEVLVSEKDAKLPFFSEFKTPFKT